MMDEKMLFALLRLGLGTVSPRDEDITGFKKMTCLDWINMKRFTDRQCISAIAYDGLRALIDEFGLRSFCESDVDWFDEFVQKWQLNVEESYEAGNIKQLIVINDIQERWQKEGIRMMLLKGMGLGTCYPVPQHRAVGDIDCYLFDDYDKGNRVAESFADRVDMHWYKHSQIHYYGELIENHKYFVLTREGRRTKKLNSLMVGILENAVMVVLPGTEVLLPPPMFNAMFLTDHALSHFLEEGLRMKQLVDWAMFLKHDADKIDWPLFYAHCEEYHLRRFAEVATDFAVNYLGVSLNNREIVSSSPYTAKVIHSALYDDDFVFNSGQGKWANRWHIVKNLFKYRWKFHEIYQKSVIGQLWRFASGLLLKKE